MNKFLIAIGVVLVLTFAFTETSGLEPMQLSIVFGVVAALLAPVAVHKIPNPSWSLGALVGMAFFVGHPLKSALGVQGYGQEMALNVACFAALWVIGFGWKRSWSRNG